MRCTSPGASHRSQRPPRWTTPRARRAPPTENEVREMTPEVRSTSPDGRYRLVVTSWEARNSLWVDTPQVVEATTGEPLLRFSSDKWSVDANRWESASVLEL